MKPLYYVICRNTKIYKNERKSLINHKVEAKIIDRYSLL